MKRLITTALFASLLAGCANLTQGPDGSVGLFTSRSEQQLAHAIRSYEEGQYKVANLQLQAALEMKLKDRKRRAVAYKYLAFIDCAAGREKSCRDDFRQAFEADPEFDLKPSEAGHPLWGPVFRQVRVETTRR